jgi:hypothetical protein
MCAKSLAEFAEGEKIRFIFARACTAQKYREPVNVQADRKAAGLCAEPAHKIKANARGIRFEGGDNTLSPPSIGRYYSRR